MDRYSFSKQELTVLEGLQQAFAVYQFVNKRVVTLALSDGFCDIFGYSDRETAYYDMDHDMYKNTHPDDVARISEAAYDFAVKKSPVYDVVYRTKTKDGSDYHIIHASGKHVYTDTGVQLAHVWYTDEGIFSGGDDTASSYLNKSLLNNLHEASLIKESHFDFLTGLPSMTYFFELVENSKKSCAPDDNCAMLFIDLSGMKIFNSKHGFSEGDKLIQAFSRVLVRHFNSENCCHISGDHFAVFTKRRNLEERLQKLFDECRKMNNGNSLPLRVGIYSACCENIPVSVACDRAKFACDDIRNTFESGYNYYNKAMSEDAERRQYILTNLDRAISEKWIKVYYQPIVRAVNSRVCDEEALARWIDPVKGFLSPGFFIPFLEESGLIYKLDLYMLEQVLEKMNYQKSAGFPVVPHSINISRSDFKTCDIVEEVRRRVDEAGVPRYKITIEVTESAIGSNFDFMKEQIKRFQQLGFPVWMDDFGSGYSSLDVLSSIKFDLLKFDMIFMKKFDEDENRKILMTELMRMATALGIDTVCEGVETKEQVRFLQEIGCSKLQGFYFEKPIPLEKILEKYDKGIQIGYENHEQSEYYEAMGRVNLYDLSAIANGGENDFHNLFNTLPMGIMEMQNGKVRFVRSNPSYRDFIKRFFGINMSDIWVDFSQNPTAAGKDYLEFINQCCNTSNRMVYDEMMPDGSTVHSFARRVAQDPATGKTAIAVAVLSITKANEGTTYATIARALASDYYNIYYVDLETDRFIEYTSAIGEEELAVERHGKHFFDAARRDTMVRIYEDDREIFLNGFTKENIIHELSEHGTFSTTYRLIDSGEPTYVNMKISRMRPDNKHIIIGISTVDSQMKQHELNDAIQRERAAYSRIIALSGDYLSLFTIDPENGSYFEYEASEAYKNLGLKKSGKDFFEAAISNGKNMIFPDEAERYKLALAKENVMNEISRKGAFELKHRIMLEGEYKNVHLKIVPVTENGKTKLIAGLKLIPQREQREQREQRDAAP